MHLIKRYFFPLIVVLFLIYCFVSIFRSSFIVEGIRYFVLSDDQMIGMKYAYNLVHGNGLIWSTTEGKVEGITNPLFVLFMAAVHLLPLPLEKISIVVQIAGAIFLVSTLLFVKKITVLISGSSKTVVIASILFTAFYFPLIHWSVLLGVEVGLLALLLSSAVFYALKSVKTKSFTLLLFLILSLGILVRLDFLIPSAVIIIYLIIFDKKNRRKYFLTGIPIIILVLIFQEIVRFLYYRELLPNTYYQKLTGYPLLNRLTRGIFVSLKIFLPNLLSMNIILIITPFIYALVSKNKQIMLLLSIFSAQVLYNIYVGGDAWEHYGGANRYVASSMPLFFISLIYSVNSFKRFLFKKNNTKIITVMEIIFLVFVFFVLNRASNNTESLRGLLMIGRPLTSIENEVRVREALALKRIATPDAVISVSAAGIVPYFAHGNYVDPLGKSNKVVARGKMHKSKIYPNLLSEFTEFYPGHMKWNYPYIVETYNPDIFVEFYQNYGQKNDEYLFKKGYIQMVTKDGFGFFIRRDSKNVITQELKLVPVNK